MGTDRGVGTRRITPRNHGSARARSSLGQIELFGGRLVCASIRPLASFAV
jgi:hypothetical protein